MGLRNHQHITLPVAGQLRSHSSACGTVTVSQKPSTVFSLILVFTSCGLLNQRAEFETIQCCFLQELTHLSGLEIQAVPGLTQTRQTYFSPKDVLMSPEAPFSWTTTLVGNEHAQTSSHNRSPCSFMFCFFLFILVFVFSYTIKCQLQNMIDRIILSNPDLTGIKYFCYQTFMFFSYLYKYKQLLCYNLCIHI